MNKSFFIIFSLILQGSFPLFGSNQAGIAGHDTLNRQLLYNGRVWRNLNSKVKGDPFLFSQEFLSGTVIVNGKTFKGVKIRYDIYKDEILISTDKIIILQANKEMVDGFTLNYSGINYVFRNFEESDQNPLSGFVNIVYNEDTPLLVKYRKEIDTSGSDNIYGTFYQSNKVYVRKDGILTLINSRAEFLRLLKEKKAEIRKFIKTNKIKITKTDPFSYARILEYYDSIK